MLLNIDRRAGWNA